MNRYSIRARLTAWYVAILAVATLAMIGGSWWLSAESITQAADAGLRARVEGVRHFLEDPQTVLTTDALQDEFREYAELTRGEALLAVVDASGAVLCRPAVPGWARMEQRIADHATAGEVQSIDRHLGGFPFRVAASWIEARGHRYRVTVATPMQAADAAIERFHTLLILLVPMALLVAGAGGYWLSCRALAPVDRITAAAQAITIDRLDQRLELPPADDELRRLTVTVNDMLARLQSAVGEMVRFTADASHELRTPVALIRTTAELALRHPRPTSEYRQALEDVLAYSRHMTGLVSDLLTLTRADAGIEAAESAAVSLTAIAQDACIEIEPAARSRSVRVSLDTCDEDFMVNGDRRALGRLLAILLDNAVRYTPSGGDVHVRLRDVRGSDGRAPAVALSVTDSGIGIDPAEVPRLFERFYRGVRARQCEPDGSGLGLAIARTIVERHHGSISIAAVPGEQRGCCVEVILPQESDASSMSSRPAPARRAATVH